MIVVSNEEELFRRRLIYPVADWKLTSTSYLLSRQFIPSLAFAMDGDINPPMRLRHRYPHELDIEWMVDNNCSELNAQELGKRVFMFGRIADCRDWRYVGPEPWVAARRNLGRQTHSSLQKHFPSDQAWTIPSYMEADFGDELRLLFATRPL